MADFTQAEKINLFLKMIFGIEGLSNTDDALGLRWYNERYSWTPFVLNQELWVGSIPSAANATEADANVAANPTLIEHRDVKMTPVNGTNGRAWIAYQTYNLPSSGIYGDWLLPQLFGVGYALRFFQDNGAGAIGTEITTTQGAWIPAYKLGAVVLANNYTAGDLGWTQPLWVRVYRYKGAKGVSGSTAGVSLDDAYNFGHSISVDNGPISLNASGSGAPLQITPISYTPSVGLAAGQVCNNGGILYSYDGTRGKWLSLDQNPMEFSARQGDGNYLASGWQSDSHAGRTMERNGTIVAIAASGGSGNAAKGFAVRKNGVLADITTFSLAAGKHYSTAIDIDFSAGDILQVYCSADGAPVVTPRVDLVTAWRI